MFFIKNCLVPLFFGFYLCKKTKYLIHLFLLPSLFLPSQTLAGVGFFSPSGVHPEFANLVDTATISATNDITQTVKNFELAYSSNLKINIDFTDIISTRRKPEYLRSSYVNAAGDTIRKRFLPKQDNKVRNFLPDPEIINIISQYARAIEPYQEALGVIFLVDEPYLNGVSKAELERVGRIVKNGFRSNGIKLPRLGVLFAGAMFNPAYAERTQLAAWQYVENIDKYLTLEEMKVAEMLPGEDQLLRKTELENWRNAFSNNRLTTYDIAGNMYTGGGIPEGFDLVAFDFYTSTILFDTLYEDAISWLAQKTRIPECNDFTHVKMSSFRSRLSFFSDKAISSLRREYLEDKKLLDSIYLCRIKAALTLLKEERILAGNKSIEIMLVSESSGNGFLDFDSNGLPKGNQDVMIVEKRIIDEIHRAISMYKSMDVSIDHLSFFTFHDEFDYAINLKIIGVSSIPGAIELIAREANRERTP